MPFNASIEIDGGVQGMNGAEWVGAGKVGLNAPSLPFPYELDASCGTQGHFKFTYTGITDGANTFHSFGTGVHVGYGTGCTPAAATGITIDGSHIQVDFSVDVNDFVTYTVTYPNGVHITNVGTPLLTDPNGNHIQVSPLVEVGSWVDTLGVTELTASWTNGGTAPYTQSYQYPTAGGTATVTENFGSHAMKTNYGCSGILEFPSQFSPQPLLDSISLPDGSSYSFTYETTPGYPGYTTGRLASVTLPTGGVISYAYTGPNNGINCADGTPAGLTRTISGGSWTYTRVSPWKTTTLIDPSGNKSTYTFLNGYAPFYEGQRQFYQGTSTLLSTVTTCYNGNQTNCATASLTPPITQKDVYTLLVPMSSSARTTTKFDGYGNVTERDAYDFGASTTTLTTFIAYGSGWNGTSCPAIGNGINNRPCYVNQEDGNNNLLQSTLFYYDAKGNMTSQQAWKSPSTYLVNSSTYNTNGTVATSTDVNGAVTTYAYIGTGGCNNGFVTSVTTPLSLTSSMQWNCNIAKVTQATDPNSATVSTTYNDVLLRPTSTTDSLNNTTSLFYNDVVNDFYRAHDLYFNSNNSDTEGATGFDPYGRVVEQASGLVTLPPNPSWNSVVNTYDSNGRVNKVYMPCTITLYGYPWSCSTPYTTQTYDALNRPLVTTDGGNGTITKSYSGRDVTITLGPAPAGEVVKTTRKEYDGLGRLKSSCQISSASGSGSCGQDIGGTGFLTTYSYDALGRVLSVVKNAQSGTTQTRTFTYDTLGRVLTARYPESGITSYTYDTVSSTYCAKTHTGDLVQKIDAAGNYTCYDHDSLHRPTYVGNWAISNNTNHGFVYDSATVNGQVMQNAKGRLAEAFTDHWNGSTTVRITDEGFSYDANGRQTDLYESTPNSGGYYHENVGHWANGAISSLNLWNASGGALFPTITYGVDGEGRTSSVSATGQNPVTATSYNPASQVTGVTFGSGDSASFSFDANTGRETQYKETINATATYGTLTWNANGTLRTLAITDPFNASDTQTCNYGTSSVAGYDELGRLVSANCGSIWAQTFSYDPFDNLTKSGSITWNPGYNQSNNHITLGGTSYDANGNLSADSFHTYTWDANWQKPITVDSTSLIYDALGRMVETTNGATHSQFVPLIGGRRFAFLNGQTLSKAIIPLPGGTEAIYTSVWNRYRVPDWLGSMRIGSGTNRTWTFSQAFAPFGEQYSQSGSVGEIEFAENGADIATNLFDAENREMQAQQGRWISPDPAHAGWNAYAYSTDPLAKIDPSGLDGIKVGSNFDWKGGSITGGYGAELGDLPGHATETGYWYQKPATLGDLVPSGKDVIPLQCGQGEDMCVTAADTEWKVYYASWTDAIPDFFRTAFSYWAGSFTSVPESQVSGLSDWAHRVNTVCDYCVGGSPVKDEEVVAAILAVTFGHGARHLEGTGLSQAAVESAIQADVQSAVVNATQTGNFWSRVTVNGQTVEYRAYTLPNGTINIGTYYVP